MKLYKLTDANGCTHGGTQWGENVTHGAVGRVDQELCTDGWIHAYEHPLLAVLLSPIHANFSDPVLWEAEGDVGKRDGQLKAGCRQLTTIKKIALPEVTTEQRVKFVILCVKMVYHNSAWNLWADNWLSGKDRTAAAAAAAVAAAAVAAAAVMTAKAEWAAKAAEWAAKAAVVAAVATERAVAVAVAVAVMEAKAAAEAAAVVVDLITIAESL